ncbi:CD44 antigen isoform X4 [Perognathus longimembris pacificus]|uniref:CD44 antigen isoform X4 n=1 Tax=Perognathus longimembris pacificus TaxID=214514 RepID=UPI002019F5E7|nr:CD44 antigen isoform X4 [Perognathus longimembris pacificus]
MNKFWWHAAWGLYCLVQLSLAQSQIDLNITCRFAGVFHVEKNGRYSISQTEAADLCKAFNSTLPTMAQMEQALSKGFETCRYGFIEGHVVIPRINPNSICAANNTGVYILTSNTSHYDTYCFNASAPPDKEDCASVTDLPSSFDGPVTITIVNRDGTRYSKKGEYRTNPEDINPTNSNDEELSSGSPSEKGTSESYIFSTNLPVTDSSPDQDTTSIYKSTPATITSTVHSNSHAAAQKQSNWMWFWFDNSQPKTQDITTSATTALVSTRSATPERETKRQEAQHWLSWLFQPSESKNHLPATTKIPGMESNTTSTGWEPNEENEDERDKHISFSGSGIDDDEDFITSTISATPWGSIHTKQSQDPTQWKPSHSNAEVLLQTATRMTDIDRNSTSAQEENQTMGPQPPIIHHEHWDEEENPRSASTTWATPSSTTEETTTPKEQWFVSRWHGEYPQTAREDSQATSGTTASAHNSHSSERITTQSQEDSFQTDFFSSVSHPMGPDHQTEGRTDMVSNHNTTLQPTADPNPDLMKDLDRTAPVSMTTQQSHSQSYSTSSGDPQDKKDHPTASTPTSSNRNDSRGGNLPEDSTTPLEGYTTPYPDTMENKTLSTLTPTQTGASEETEVTVAGESSSLVDGFLPGDQDAMDSSGRSHTTHGSESNGPSSGSQEGEVNTTSGPIRKPQIPEWLIILASLLALALILAVCIAVNSRRRCGQKKKLVINNGNGTVEDRKPSELNGDASKSQEMVHLVNKESSETPDQFTTTDETQSLQNADVKVGV